MSALNLETFWAVPASIFIAGFIGSPHCVAMCGPLVLGFASSRAQMISYQLGRLSTYSLAGGVAGLVGATVLDSLRDSKTGFFVLTAMFIALIAIGYMQISGRKLHVGLPSILSTPITRAFARIRLSRIPKEIVSFSAGALSVGLPCAHLWSFLLGAAAMSSVTGGTLFMAAFWLGTLPALVAAPWSLMTLKRALGNRAAVVSGTIMIVAGLMSLAHFSTQLGRTPNGHHLHGEHAHHQPENKEQSPASFELKHEHHAHH